MSLQYWSVLIHLSLVSIESSQVQTMVLTVLSRGLKCWNQFIGSIQAFHAMFGPEPFTNWYNLYWLDVIQWIVITIFRGRNHLVLIVEQAKCFWELKKNYNLYRDPSFLELFGFIDQFHFSSCKARDLG